MVPGARVPDARTAALVVLLHSGGLHTLVFADADQPSVEQCVGDLTESRWADPAMKQLVDAVHVALTTYAASTAVEVTSTGTGYCSGA